MNLARCSLASCCRLAAEEAVREHRTDHAWQAEVGGGMGMRGRGHAACSTASVLCPSLLSRGVGILGTTSSAPALCFLSISPQLTQLYLAPVKYLMSQ